MTAEKKRKLHGKLIEKLDLGQYSKSFGKEPLYTSDTQPHHAKLYK